MFLRSKKCIGFLHFGQIGGGAFFGMMLTLDQARALPDSLSPIAAGTGAMISKLYRRKNRFVCTVLDSQTQNVRITCAEPDLVAAHIRRPMPKGALSWCGLSMFWRGGDTVRSGRVDRLAHC
jgi:hypothetical protein